MPSRTPPRKTGRSRWRRWAFALPVVGLLLAAGCDATDKQLVTEIGTSRIMMVSPGLGSQRIKNPEGQMQVAIFNVLQADLTLADGNKVDLRANTKCTMIDTAVVNPTTRNRCEGGIVLDKTNEPTMAVVDVRFQMEVRRAEPVDLPPGGDFDGDGVPNESDVCPLRVNPKQNIAQCSRRSPVGSFQGDADFDGTVDEFDNCVWISNFQFDNTMGASEEYGVDDLIGDACNEQIAFVEDAGSRFIEFFDQTLEIEIFEKLATFVIIDVDHRTALDCDFDAGVCQLNRDAVDICTSTNPLTAAVGCP